MYARTSSSSLPASFDRPADQIRMVPIFSSGPGFQIEPPRNKIRNKSNVIFLADGGSGCYRHPCPSRRRYCSDTDRFTFSPRLPVFCCSFYRYLFIARQAEFWKPAAASHSEKERSVCGRCWSIRSHRIGGFNSIYLIH